MESHEPPANAASAAASETEGTPNITTDASAAVAEERKAVTTEERKPLQVPESVHVRIAPENLKDYVGPPVYYKDRLFKDAPPSGVSTGLGYLGNGSGAVMPIEALVSASLVHSLIFADWFRAQSMPGKGSLQLTGKLGEVIRESAQIALSWVKSHAYELGITGKSDEQFLNDIDVHVHMPEGSIGKEGPSAGTALLTAFVSLFTKAKVNPDVGEIQIVASAKS